MTPEDQALIDEARKLSKYNTILSPDVRRLQQLVPALLSLIERQRVENERLTEALTPSAATKEAYIGEFNVPYPVIDENGDEIMQHINVPWTTIKEIMAAIRARQALTGEEG